MIRSLPELEQGKYPHLTFGLRTDPNSRFIRSKMGPAFSSSHLVKSAFPIPSGRRNCHWPRKSAIGLMYL